MRWAVAGDDLQGFTEGGFVQAPEDEEMAHNHHCDDAEVSALAGGQGHDADYGDDRVRETRRGHLLLQL